MFWYRAVFIIVLGLAFGLIGQTGPVHADSGNWASVPPMPTARTELAAVTGADGRIYAIGGSNGFVSLATVEAFDPTTSTWASVAPLPEPRQDLAAVRGLDGRIYVIGGRSCSRAHCSYLASVDVYNPQTNSWSTVARLPTPRAELAAATGPNGHIYAVGGFTPVAGVTTVEVYDPHANSWSTVAPLPSARSALATAAGSDGRIYVLGGTGPSGFVTNTVDAYDPSSNTWSAGANMPTNRANLTAVLGPDGLIYAIGGSYYHEGSQALNAVEAYAAGTNRWVSTAPLPVPLAFVAAALGLDGRIYVLGATTTMVSIHYANAVFTPRCRFVLGFGLLRARIPNTVGFCLDNEQHNPVNGDALQRTTRGLLVWRKADNFTAFTDGDHTWVNGPYGLQNRLNTQRFWWESNPSGLPTVR